MQKREETGGLLNLLFEKGEREGGGLLERITRKGSGYIHKREESPPLSRGGRKEKRREKKRIGTTLSAG